jgi:glutamate synthase (NADPH/NADH) small chain
MARKIGQKTRTPMPCIEAHERVRNFREVACGYTAALAVQEATRCIDCRNRPCVTGCPVEIDIPSFVRRIAASDFEGAFRTLTDKNILPAVCGRVCPQENQCEKHCTLGVRFEPVAIGRLERFVADWHAEQPNASGTGASSDVREFSRRIVTPPEWAPTGHAVAVVGSGPGGLTAAADLARLGHRVTIFEALHKPGGVLIYGIPEFRLPKSIVEREIAQLQALGVEIKVNQIIGRTFTIDDLFEKLGFEAVFIATGAGLPHFPNIPGVNAVGVLSANEYLTRSNLMKAHRFPEYDTPVAYGKHVAVIGGGNTAVDAVRTARRLGAETAYLIYRRSRAEMPARSEEIAHALEEEVKVIFLAEPVEVLMNEDRHVRGVRCVRMELGEPDASGRRSPRPVNGSEFELDAQVVVFAIGQGANPLIRSTTPDLSVDARGYIVADPITGATRRRGVFAGGDVVTGGATVISAMGAGRRAARAIHEYLVNSAATSATCLGGGGMPDSANAATVSH